MLSIMGMEKAIVVTRLLECSRIGLVGTYVNATLTHMAVICLPVNFVWANGYSKFKFVAVMAK